MASANEYYDHLMNARRAWPDEADGRPLTVADGLALIVATRDFVQPYATFGHYQLTRWINPQRHNAAAFAAAPRYDAPTPAVLRRVMCGMVAYSAGLLTTSPHGAYRDADRHFRLADGIIQRVFQGYRGKVQRTVNDFMSAACARISVKPNIFEAAKSGDCSLLRDHLALDPSCIHKREDGSQHTPLHKSSRSGQVAACRLLVHAGCEVDAKNILIVGRTPLHDAASKGHAAVCRFLVESGASVHSRDHGNATPLHLSALRGNVDVSEFLVQARADISAEDNSAKTPLHCSASEGHVSVCKFLVQAGAVVDAKDRFQGTPLHNAALNGHVDACKFLVQVHANISAETSDGRTPLDWAEYAQKPDVCAFLRSLGASARDEHSLSV